MFRRAIEAGINFINTCDYYSAGVSEEIVGTLVAEHGNRDELVIATKVGNPMGRDANARGFSRKHIINAAEKSLRRLRTDHVDLYQTHIWDPTTNLDEMMAAFDHLVRAGKVLYVGITDMPFWQFATAYFTAQRAGLATFTSGPRNLYLVCGTPEPHHADANAPVYPADERLLKEARQPQGVCSPAFRALQLCSGSPILENHPSDGGRINALCFGVSETCLRQLKGQTRVLEPVTQIRTVPSAGIF